MHGFWIPTLDMASLGSGIELDTPQAILKPKNKILNFSFLHLGSGWPKKFRTTSKESNEKVKVLKIILGVNGKRKQPKKFKF